MAAIYDITMFLCIALLAVVVTVFVLAVSLLGRAIEEARTEQGRIQENENEEHRKSVARMQAQLDQAKLPEEMSKLREYCLTNYSHGILPLITKIEGIEWQDVQSVATTK